MPHKLSITCSLVSILYMFSFFSPSGSLHDGEDQGREEYRVVVKVINDEWRVVWEDDESKSDVTLRRGDRIRWVVEGSDASFQFPDARIFGRDTLVLKLGEPRVMAVSANSPKGKFAYTVFVHKSMTYARGQSPPRIIVR